MAPIYDVRIFKATIEQGERPPGFLRDQIARNDLKHQRAVMKDLRSAVHGESGLLTAIVEHMMKSVARRKKK